VPSGPAVSVIFLPSSAGTTFTVSMSATSPPHAYERSPNHARDGWPGVAMRAARLPSSGGVFGTTEKFSLNCSTTGATTPRLLMISISASVGACCGPLLIIAPVCVCVSACVVLSLPSTRTCTSA
jgi:hypothetical protein